MLLLDLGELRVRLSFAIPRFFILYRWAVAIPRRRHPFTDPSTWVDPLWVDLDSSNHIWAKLDTTPMFHWRVLLRSDLSKGRQGGLPRGTQQLPHPLPLRFYLHVY